MRKLLRVRVLPGALSLAAAMTLVACGGDDDSGAEADDGVRTGPGVTADTITLGALTDASGPFKDLALNLRAGEDLWAADVNATGGVCGRLIKVEERDHGYKADLAKVQFPEVEPQVAGFLEVVGSPMLAALKNDIADREVPTLAVSWSSELLDQPYMLVAGTTYDVEMINALSYLRDEGLLADGDTFGHIYIEGEYGGNALLGSRFFAERHDMTLVEKKVTATDTDMTSIVTGLRGDGVKAIALSSTPPQAASTAAASKALGMNVPLVGNYPVFSPLLMDTPAAEALSKLFVVGSTAPFAADIPKATEVARKYEAAYTETPSSAVQFGYAVGLMWQQILERACAADDLSREGIFAAKNASTTIDTQGLTVDLDLSEPGSPSARESFITTPDAALDGRLRQVGSLYSSDAAKEYQAPHEG